MGRIFVKKWVKVILIVIRLTEKEREGMYIRGVRTMILNYC